MSLIHGDDDEWKTDLVTVICILTYTMLYMCSNLDTVRVVPNDNRGSIYKSPHIQTRSVVVHMGHILIEEQSVSEVEGYLRWHSVYGCKYS